VTGFGIRQFVTILLTLSVLGGGGYWAYENIFKSQTETYASLADIQKELADLTFLNGQLRSTLEQNHAEIEALLSKAIKALNNKDYPTAIQDLENVSEKAPVSTVYQNIAYAYDKLGNKDKANAALLKVKESKHQTEIYKNFAQNLSGIWTSPEWGNMEIVQTGDIIIGQYTHDNGQLKGSIKNNKIVFTWWEKLEKGQSFESAAKGERGDGYFNISAESKSIKGEWRYDGDTNWKNVWTATKK
jgi:tetratricopeptide (TPR) repeat protein